MAIKRARIGEMMMDDLSIYLSIYLSNHPPIHPSIHLSTYRNMCGFNQPKCYLDVSETEIDPESIAMSCGNFIQHGISGYLTAAGAPTSPTVHHDFREKMTILGYTMTGWWFGTWFLWLSIIYGIIFFPLTNSIIFQRVAQPPTRHVQTNLDGGQGDSSVKQRK